MKLDAYVKKYIGNIVINANGYLDEHERETLRVYTNEFDYHKA